MEKNEKQSTAKLEHRAYGERKGNETGKAFAVIACMMILLNLWKPLAVFPELGHWQNAESGREIQGSGFTEERSVLQAQVEQVLYQNLKEQQAKEMKWKSLEESAAPVSTELIPEKITPIETMPAEEQVVEMLPTVTETIETVPIVTEPIETVPIVTEPAVTEPIIAAPEEIVTDETLPEVVIPTEEVIEEVPLMQSRNGFLINESGMIYGFLTEEADLSSGVLRLPETDCIGVAAGALSACGNQVLEISIPANITVLESGAFAGLYGLEWFETDGGSLTFSSMDGVLFTADGSGLLACPAARIGIYSVPSGVQYVDASAFTGTALEKVDIRMCPWTEGTCSLPAGCELIK